MPSLPRVTYSNINADFTAVHDTLDKVIREVGSNLGGVHLNFINGSDCDVGQPYIVPCPVSRTENLGTFIAASPAAVSAAVNAARSAYPAWAKLGWVCRVAIARKAAEVIERDKYKISAACLLEVGKSRMEAVGEVEEAIDIIRYYSDEMERNSGYFRPLKQAQESEITVDVLRPYGVFAVIAPFNFPVALSIGMSICALLAGNTVVYKPSPMAGLTGRLICDSFAEGGFPDGVFNLVNGGNSTGEALANNLDISGIAFTGSNKVGMRLLRSVGAAGKAAKPVLAEMGGKNPTYICASADLDTAVSGMLRSAFGLQGQKCSAGSVVFVHEAIYEPFLKKLVRATKEIKIGDPFEREVFMGPVIDELARDRYQRSVKLAQDAGGTVHGGSVLSGGIYDKGFFVEPTIVTDLPDDHALHEEELFLPFLTVRTFTKLTHAISRGNAVEYGLTAGIYTQDDEELEEFLETAEAGVLYANRASGATTGAWPGMQTFCGWKGSGTGSKGGLGPWYLPQFMREQSHTIMRHDV